MTARTFVSVLLLTAGAVLAQPTTQPATQPTDPALKGPAVKQAGVPGENRQFGDGKVKGKERMGTEIPHRLFMKSLDSLRGDSADAAVRLSADQNSKIKAIDDAFSADVAKYREAHQGEARDLAQNLSPEDRKKAMAFLGREGRAQGDKAAKLGKGKGKAAPEAGDMSSADAKKSEDAKAKLRELMEGAPKSADTHARIFAVLSDTQKAAFQKQLDTDRKEMQERAGGKKLDRKAAAKGAPVAGKDLDINDPRIPEKMRERLKNMPPAEQQQALERMRDRINRGGEAKPAPSTKDVQVPAPDNK